MRCSISPETEMCVSISYATCRFQEFYETDQFACKMPCPVSLMKTMPSYQLEIIKWRVSVMMISCIAKSNRNIPHFGMCLVPGLIRLSGTSYSSTIVDLKFLRSPVTILPYVSDQIIQLSHARILQGRTLKRNVLPTRERRVIPRASNTSRARAAKRRWQMSSLASE